MSLNPTSLRRTLAATLILTAGAGCIPTPPGGTARDPRRDVPESYAGLSDSSNSGLIVWSEFFDDPHLTALVEKALHDNQELNITMQEAWIANAEVLGRTGDYLPQVGFGLDAGVEHVGAFTSQGRSDEEHGVAANLQDYGFGLYASWEIDVWGRLRNLANAAAYRYLASIEGRNLLVTRLVAEIASNYYQLMALDQQLQVVTDNIALQENGLAMVQAQFQAGRATSLAANRFEAELRGMQSAQYDIQQRIVETENQINFLVGRFPQPVERSTANFLELQPAAMSVGVPSQLLENRPDIRQAEREMAAAGLDVQAARAAFYPSLGIDGTIGFQSFDITQLLRTPDSLLYSIFAHIFAPLLNRRGLKAEYFAANSREMQAVLRYERAVLVGVIEVSNRVSLIHNLSEGYALKQQQVDRLAQSIEISNQLFNSARADYLEVLTTRRESLEAQIELIEMKQRQMEATVTLYQALGGGWRRTGLGPEPGTAFDDRGDAQNVEEATR